MEIQSYKYWFEFNFSYPMINNNFKMNKNSTFKNSMTYLTNKFYVKFYKNRSFSTGKDYNDSGAVMIFSPVKKHLIEVPDGTIIDFTTVASFEFYPFQEVSAHYLLQEPIIFSTPHVKYLVCDFVDSFVKDNPWDTMFRFPAERPDKGHYVLYGFLTIAKTSLTDLTKAKGEDSNTIFRTNTNIKIPVEDFKPEKLSFSTQLISAKLITTLITLKDGEWSSDLNKSEYSTLDSQAINLISVSLRLDIPQDKS